MKSIAKSNDASLGEIYAIYAILAFLPSLEAPKNIAIAIYLILFAIRCIKTGSWGNFAIWDAAALAIAGSGVSSIYFGLFPSDKGLLALGDILSYLLVFSAIWRTRFTEKSIRNFLYIAIASTTLTLFHGYWTHYISHTTEYLKINSVGHINHGAIYLAITIAIAVSLYKEKISNLLAFLLVAFLWVSLFIMQARGAIIPSILFVIVLIFVSESSPKQKAGIALTLFLITAITLTLLPGAIDKTRGNIHSNDISSKRIELAHTALLAVREAPLAGVGLNNFNKITPDITNGWQNKSGEMFPEEALYHSSHAHNIYFTTLAERGIIGVTALTGLLLYIGYNLASNRPKCSLTSTLGHTLWASSIGTLIIVLIGGIFNTTLHHEHGMLAMIIWGLWLSHHRNTANKLQNS